MKKGTMLIGEKKGVFTWLNAHWNKFCTLFGTKNEYNLTYITQTVWQKIESGKAEQRNVFSKNIKEIRILKPTKKTAKIWKIIQPLQNLTTDTPSNSTEDLPSTFSMTTADPKITQYFASLQTPAADLPTIENPAIGKGLFEYWNAASLQSLALEKKGFDGKKSFALPNGKGWNHYTVREFDMRRDPFEVGADKLFSYTTPQGDLSIKASALQEEFKGTAQYYADNSAINEDSAKKAFGGILTPNLLGYNSTGKGKGLSLETLRQTINGGSRPGPEAFNAGNYITASSIHFICERDRWLHSNEGNNTDIGLDAPLELISRPGINVSYGKDNHADLDFQLFEGKLSDPSLYNSFRNLLLYRTFLQLAVTVERGITVPTLSDIGCGNFAGNQKHLVWQATAEAYALALTLFPQNTIRGVSVTAFEKEKVFREAFSRLYKGTIPVSIESLDITNTKPLADQANIKTNIVNAADAHGIRGEYCFTHGTSIEEGLGRATTMHFTQNASTNPRYAGCESNFRGFDLHKLVDFMANNPNVEQATESAITEFKDTMDKSLKKDWEAHNIQSAHHEEILLEYQAVCNTWNKKLKVQSGKEFTFKPDMVTKDISGNYWLRFENKRPAHDSLKKRLLAELKTPQNKEEGICSLVQLPTL